MFQLERKAVLKFQRKQPGRATFRMTKQNTIIEISVETYTKLRSLREKLRKITRRKLGFDDTLRVLLAVKPLDDALTDLILEG